MVTLAWEERGEDCSDQHGDIRIKLVLDEVVAGVDMEVVCGKDLCRSFLLCSCSISFPTVLANERMSYTILATRVMSCAWVSPPKRAPCSDANCQLAGALRLLRVLIYMKQEKIP
ncbi:hypothetical protein LguiA_007322 [Lonicera macranthoides]